MNIQISTQTSSVNQVLGISFAALAMFIVGYTATRVYLNQPTNITTNESIVIPHQASLWSELGSKN
jgi:hypothetical protein